MSELRVCAVCNAPVGPEWNRCEEHRQTRPEYAVLKPNDFSTFTHPLSRPEYAALKPDHGITPAQLREKVEELEAQVTSIAIKANAEMSRLDAALNRILQLEAQQSMWRGNKRPPAPIDSEDV